MAKEAEVLLAGLDNDTEKTASASLLPQWTLTSAKDGRTAEEAVRKRTYTAVIVDWDIHGVSAVELIKSALGWNRMTCVIVLVKADRNADATCAIDAGATACLSKPIDARYLTSLVSRAHEKTRLNRELALATHRMQDLIDAISEFLASLSHDLRTPLAIMHGYAETLLHYGDQLPAEKKTIYLNYIRDGSQKITQTMTEFLGLSRKGMSTISPEKIDLPNLVGQIFMAACDESRAIHLDHYFEPAAQEVVTDKKRLAHALQYAIAETLQHSADGTKIFLRGRQTSGEIVVCFSDRAVELSSVTPPGTLAAADGFEASGNSQSEVSEEREANISITIARCILKVLGGEVWIHQDENGFRLTLTLPREYKPSKRNHG